MGNFTTNQEVYRTITNLNMSTDISPKIASAMRENSKNNRVKPRSRPSLCRSSRRDAVDSECNLVAQSREPSGLQKTQMNPWNRRGVHAKVRGVRWHVTFWTNEIVCEENIPKTSSNGRSAIVRGWDLNPPLHGAVSRKSPLFLLTTLAALSETWSRPRKEYSFHHVRTEN